MNEEVSRRWRTVQRLQLAAVVAGGPIEIELALFNQLEDGDGRERLRHRSEPVRQR
jgi:hypothetical protein